MNLSLLCTPLLLTLLKLSTLCSTSSPQKDVLQFSSPSNKQIVNCSSDADCLLRFDLHSSCSTKTTGHCVCDMNYQDRSVPGFWAWRPVPAPMTSSALPSTAPTAPSAPSRAPPSAAAAPGTTSARRKVAACFWKYLQKKMAIIVEIQTILQLTLLTAQATWTARSRWASFPTVPLRSMYVTVMLGTPMTSKWRSFVLQLLLLLLHKRFTVQLVVALEMIIIGSAKGT